MKFRVYPENQYGISKNFDYPFQPFWINKSLLEELWSRDKGFYFHEGEHNKLKAKFFIYEEEFLSDPIFLCDRAYISDYMVNDKKIHFSGGRHRTRWLCDIGIDPIPIAFFMGHDDINLPLNKISKGDTVNLPVSIEDLFNEQLEYDDL